MKPKNILQLAVLIISGLILTLIILVLMKYHSSNSITSVYRQMSDGDKSFWGSLLGSLIGTMGAFGAAIFAVWIDRLTNRQRENKELLRGYNRYLITAEVALNEFLPAMLKNNLHLESVSKLRKPGNFLMTLPRPMELRYANVELMRNSQLIDQWSTLCIRTKIINQLIDDFVAYYVSVRDITQTSMIKNEAVNEKYVTEDFKTLNAFAADAKSSIDAHIQFSIEVLALIQLHGEKGANEKAKFKHPNELNDFAFTPKEIREKSAVLKRKFTDKMFSDARAKS